MIVFLLKALKKTKYFDGKGAGSGEGLGGAGWDGSTLLLYGLIY